MCALLELWGVELTDARRLLQDLFVTEADLLPDPAAERLEVHVHWGSRPAVDRQLGALFEQLNEMAFTFPGTNLKLHYQLVESSPGNQNGVTGASQR